MGDDLVKQAADGLTAAELQAEFEKYQIYTNIRILLSTNNL
jgi:hypothetical protein